MTYFSDIAKIQYEGPESKNGLAFKYYNPKETFRHHSKTLNKKTK